MFEKYKTTTDENDLVKDYLRDRIEGANHDFENAERKLKALRLALRTTSEVEKNMTVKEARELRSRLNS